MAINSSLTCLGHDLDSSPAALGELRPANDLLGNAAALHARVAEVGYLFLRDFLDVAWVLAARQEMVRRLQAGGGIDLQHPALDAVAVPGFQNNFGHDLARNNPPLHQLLYTGRMLEFYEMFLGGPVRHFDYTWYRAVEPGRHGIYPHADIVYMGRGTKNLFTSWTPTGDVPTAVGGLLILEGSNTKTAELHRYLERDVDTYCESHPDAAAIQSGDKQWTWDGRLAANPVTLRQKLGGRWLTADYRAGDVLVFPVQTVHASLDNHSNQFRLSSDSRYQLASEPADERWIGANPSAHGIHSKRGLAC